jgi:hypothetical protein
MISDYLVGNFTRLLAVLLAFFVFLKFISLFYHGVHERKMAIFLGSLGIMSKQTIKNTAIKSLKKYFKASNTINKFFYVVILAFSLFCGFVFMIRG